MQEQRVQGKIIKGIAGFYYVYAEGYGVIECKAKGIFRKDKIKPLVGDNVEVEWTSIPEKTGNIITIFPRRNALIRPAVANVDQALVIFSVTRPEPNLNLLDRFLLMMRRQNLPVVICFSKQELVSEERKRELERIYAGCEARLHFFSTREKQGISGLLKLLQGKTSTVAGPSGVGKSSLVNEICPEALMETGEISRKIERGKHTTRHTQLFHLSEDTYIMDTPGFASLGLFDVKKEELKDFYPEFEAFQGQCRFRDCVHMEEPDCAVKAAVESGTISRIRYDNYRLIYEELQ